MKKLRMLRLVPILLLLLMMTPVQAAPPQSPTLNLPLENAVLNSPTPVFNWTMANEDATSHRVQMRDAAGILVFNEVFNGTSDTGFYCVALSCLAFTNDLGVSFRNGAYSWRVIAINSEGRARTPWRNLVLDFPGRPTLKTPLNNVTAALPLVLTWDKVSLATEYQLRLVHIASGEVFTTIWIDANTVCPTDCSLTLYNNLRAGRYRWTVTARQASFPTNRSRSVPATFQVVR